MIQNDKPLFCCNIQLLKPLCDYQSQSSYIFGRRHILTRLGSNFKCTSEQATLFIIRQTIHHS